MRGFDIETQFNSISYMEEVSKKPLTVPTYLFSILSFLAIDFVLIAMSASCAFSSAETSPFCDIPDTGLWLLMIAVPSLLIAAIYQLRKRSYWKTALVVSSAPLGLLILWIVLGIAIQSINQVAAPF